jgi:hypothetical protein
MVWLVSAAVKKHGGDEGAQKDLGYKEVVNTRSVRGMDLEPKHSS